MKSKASLFYSIGLLLAAAVLYGRFLWSPLVFDDLPFFTLSDSGNQPINGYRYSPFELRSLPYATLVWGKAAFGLGLLHFRIENLLLHAAVAISLFVFLTRLFDVIYRERGVSLLSSRAMAFCAALLFVLHPVAVYAAGYLVQRTILMATLFSLLAMLAWLHGGLRENRAWLWSSVFFYYLAVFSKEHAIMLPVALVALTVLLHDDWRGSLRQRWRLFLAFAAIALFVIVAKKGILGSAYEIYAPEMLEAESGLSYPLSVLTQSWLFFKYAGLWLFPNPVWMSADMREPFAVSLFSVYALAFVAFLAWGGVALRMLLKRGRPGLFGFAMLFPWLMFMTEFSTIRIQEIFVLYRSYLWAIGACVVLPLLLDGLDKKITAVIVAATALAMFPISMDRLASFAHPLMLWSDAEKLVKGRDDLPGAYRIYFNLGTELVKVDEYDAAIRHLERSIALKPDWPFAFNNLGFTYMKKMQWQEAIGHFNKSIEILGSQGKIFARSFLGRAMAYEAMGEIEKAKLDYRVSCRLIGKGCEKLRPEQGRPESLPVRPGHLP